MTEENKAPQFKSFAAKVYGTFRLINLEGHIAQKRVGNNKSFDYLSWAVAWDFVLQTFPESDFEFDEPVNLGGAGVEIWVTVNIREGDNVLTRRWWLPVLSFKNEPVAQPSSLQINNCRMRVLVKCLAMCGLGTELYTGEDVPEAEHDAKVKGNRVVDMALDDIKVDWSVANEHITLIRAAVLNDDKDALFDAQDGMGADQEMKIAVWSKLDSKTRSYIKKATAERE
jgi:hypothetical protein